MPTVLALSGSLRRDSLNTALLRSIADALAPEVQLTIHDYAAVPLFNSDAPPSDAVAALKAAITAADAVVIATPEFNHSVPGVLKNALDHASRPAFRSPFAGKPTGVVSASPGVLGGVRAQTHLKTVLLGMGAPVFPGRELVVGKAHEKVSDGRVIDVSTLRHVAAFADGFVRWALQMHTED